MSKKTTKEEFIEKANKKHNFKFDYSKAIYIDRNNKIIIIIKCPIHGEFKQSPISHLNTTGCPKCGFEKSGKNIRLTKEEFIKKSNIVHNFKYNYDKVAYIKGCLSVLITCPVHGDFEQKPTNHLGGSGCHKCKNIKTSNRLRKTKGYFIEKAKFIHGQKYDYSKTIYNLSQKKVIITCLIHGDFLQSPSAHLQGQGCILCGNKKISELQKQTQEEFIAYCVKIYKNKYDYSEVKYCGSNQKIKIICRFHGEFEQTARDHKNGKNGCLKCRQIEFPQRQTLSTDEFIKRAIKIHNDTYRYDKTIYHRMEEKIIIACKIHGDFLQTPVCHLSGSGCSKCSGKYRKTTQEFIKQAKVIHGENYTYEKTIFSKNRERVIVTCKKHGDFNKIAEDLLNNSGCPACKETKGERTIRKYLNFKRIEYKSNFPIANIGRFDYLIKFYRYGYKIIEYHGEQHYMPTSFRKKTPATLKMLKTNIKRDLKKERWCQKYGFQLLIIPYWEFKNIDKILEASLNHQPFSYNKPPEKVLEYLKYRKKCCQSEINLIQDCDIDYQI